MAKLKPSKTKQERSKLYEMKGRASINAKRKLEAHIKKYPND